MTFLQKLKNLFSKTEPQNPLPIGLTQYDEWSKRIIEGAQVPGLTEDSANFALTSMLLHLPSTQSFHSDSFFTHALRKAAVNQTAVEVMRNIEARMKARKADEATAGLKLVTEAKPEPQ